MSQIRKTNRQHVFKCQINGKPIKATIEAPTLSQAMRELPKGTKVISYKVTK